MSEAGKSCCLDATVDAVVAERAGVLAFARSKCGEIDASAARGDITQEEADWLKPCLRAFADSIETGLHRDGHELPEVRAALRAIVKGEG